MKTINKTSFFFKKFSFLSFLMTFFTTVGLSTQLVAKDSLKQSSDSSFSQNSLGQSSHNSPLLDMDLQLSFDQDLLPLGEHSLFAQSSEGENPFALHQSLEVPSFFHQSSLGHSGNPQNFQNSNLHNILDNSSIVQEVVHYNSPQSSFEEFSSSSENHENNTQNPQENPQEALNFFNFHNNNSQNQGNNSTEINSENLSSGPQEFSMENFNNNLEDSSHHEENNQEHSHGDHAPEAPSFSSHNISFGNLPLVLPPQHVQENSLFNIGNGLNVENHDHSLYSQSLDSLEDISSLIALPSLFSEKSDKN